ncbi:glycoside hydrolase family 16 protein [Laetiporus sulphureus 93-53]|uniref:Glycoside hydrolase family 16 protein n=1 Tax=Laetiporus sulphureus 93-53 TaxID=1314785 RepID=A0A165GI39_9APHY|nr:glycoside hydrolase family 16 protein [Laetiporus sulphureus 93-53]KZT10380.1 glycoside hydrolase family 16 protein [Laetiporus sulphureus 93-53]
MLTAMLLLWAVLLSCVSSAVGYELLRDYSGENFFNGWDFYGYWDNLTLGNTTWVTEEAATQQKLAYINDAGNAIMRVDNFTTVAEGDKRNAVRITTQDYYDYGTLWILDAVHLPYGCSVWPAFWSMGHDWPVGGEIDIVEAINVMPNNQMALHTTEGCTHVTPSDQLGYSGGDDCGTGSGCIVSENAANSYESGFAAAGGGVFATQFDVTGIYMWFWSRPDIPDVIKNANSTSPMNISTWGDPHASYPNTTSCDLSTFFTEQQLIFDITLCGDWAGVPGIYDSECYAAGPAHNCYLDNVVGNGSNYDDAYFEVSYVRIYTTAAVLPSNSSSGASATSTSGDPTTSSTSATTPDPTLAQKSGASRIRGDAWLGLLAATVLTAFALF